MNTYNTFNDAYFAAKTFFTEQFGHSAEVGIESADGLTITFYSKQDPAMDDTFKCVIQDGYARYCTNGGPVTVRVTRQQLLKEIEDQNK